MTNYFLYKLVDLIDRIASCPRVFAHCDIPCGIYNSSVALLAADTVVKMVEKIQALGDLSNIQNHNSFTRMTMVKEEHAQLCKKELLILWTDYFKPEHLQNFPDLHEKFWKAAKLCSKNKQEINMEAANELKATAEEITAMFYQAEELKKKV